MSYIKDMKPGENMQQNDGLRDVDEFQIQNGWPILSILIIMEAGKPYELCSVTEESIKKYKLAKPGETHEQTVDRLREEAQVWAKTL